MVVQDTGRGRCDPPAGFTIASYLSLLSDHCVINPLHVNHAHVLTRPLKTHKLTTLNLKVHVLIIDLFLSMDSAVDALPLTERGVNFKTNRAKAGSFVQDTKHRFCILVASCVSAE